MLARRVGSGDRIGLATAPVLLVRRTRRHAPAEEAALSRAFGPRWEAYLRSVRFPRV